MKIAIGSDHVGIELKPTIIDYLKELGHEVEDFGPYSSERTDYPIYGKKVA
ncbi:ribose/galactose isomerase [Trichococcus patagoniensis]|uniref:Ribose/galactose isomerase n=1 Tax=Trichococcus patagoniensis TaxID=382641 RepID=A0A2T5IFS3_9LACT|nr:ribose/galactose isomerase [Trichococcus patagoniensis]